MRVIDLKGETEYIEQYIHLRNSYVDMLLTSFVNKNDTIKWLQSKDVEIRGVVDGEVLEGVVILYLGREGEVAFFAKERNKGIGTMLLSIAEDIAASRNMPYIWAWVLKDNMIAKHVFEKSGFLNEGAQTRNHNGISYDGVKYKKLLVQI